MKRLTIIRPNGQISIIDNGAKPTLESLQRLVGGYVQMVNVNWRGKNCVGIVNEDGKLKGLPINSLATVGMHRSGAGYAPNDSIVGTCVILEGWRL